MIERPNPMITTRELAMFYNNGSDVTENFEEDGSTRAGLCLYSPLLGLIDARNHG